MSRSLERLTYVNSARMTTTLSSDTRRATRRVVASEHAKGLYLNRDQEQRIQNRLSRLEGQVRGIKEMLAQHKSCDDILIQVTALKQASNAIAVELLHAHMEICVLGRIDAGEGREAPESLKAAMSQVLKHA